jgi:flagellar biosynthesis/type III secretory pathway M-ring protein FliF/YscJ
MSTGVIIAIVVGVLILLAIVWFASRGSEGAKRKREMREHRKAELGHAAERERAKAEAHRAEARAEGAEKERKAHEHERRARELEEERGRGGGGTGRFKRDGDRADRERTRR